MSTLRPFSLRPPPRCAVLALVALVAVGAAAPLAQLSSPAIAASGETTQREQISIRTAARLHVHLARLRVRLLQQTDGAARGDDLAQHAVVRSIWGCNYNYYGYSGCNYGGYGIIGVVFIIILIVAIWLIIRQRRRNAQNAVAANPKMASEQHSTVAQDKGDSSVAFASSPNNTAAGVPPPTAGAGGPNSGVQIAGSPHGQGQYPAASTAAAGVGAPANVDRYQTPIEVQPGYPQSPPPVHSHQPYDAHPSYQQTPVPHTSTQPGAANAAPPVAGFGQAPPAPPPPPGPGADAHKRVGSSAEQRYYDAANYPVEYARPPSYMPPGPEPPIGPGTGPQSQKLEAGPGLSDSNERAAGFYGTVLQSTAYNPNSELPRIHSGAIGSAGAPQVHVYGSVIDESRAQARHPPQ